jgi:hypothetical protein
MDSDKPVYIGEATQLGVDISRQSVGHHYENAMRLAFAFISMKMKCQEDRRHRILSRITSCRAV